jgi:regulator of cell morphogenesis and NO signaling
MTEFNTKTIREIALEMPQTTRVFEEFKIDYCCGGRKPFEEACQNAGVDPKELSQRLEMALAGVEASVDGELPERKTASDLIDYIVSKHHIFTRTEIGRLGELMEKVAKKHGPQHAELYHLQTVFNELSDDMLLHMRKEEAVLFPFIKQMEMAAAGQFPAFPPPFGTVRNPVRMMMQEHDVAADQLREMREATDDYTLPAEACPSFKALYFGLEELERDLHRHVHLENNVLFDQAEELEKTVFGDTVEAGGGCCHSH